MAGGAPGVTVRDTRSSTPTVSQAGGRGKHRQLFERDRVLIPPRLTASHDTLTVHISFVLALFRFCSADERNTRQRHAISRHLGKRS